MAANYNKMQISSISNVNENEERFHNKITFFSFICAVLVVMIHGYYTYSFYLDKVDGIESSIPVLIQKFFHDVGNVYAVQTFFVISGFLFFRNLKYSNLKSKLHTRVRSVLVPYLLWNLLYTIMFFILGNILGLMNTKVDTSVIGIVKSLFFYGTLNVFWYMFYLIICIAISPIVLFCFSYKILTVLLWIVAICVSLFIFPLNITIRATATAWYLYYLFGATIAFFCEPLATKCYVKSWSCVKKVFFLFFTVLLILINLYFSRVSTHLELLTILSIVMIWVCSDFVGKVSAYSFMKKSFVIYAMHPLICSIIQNVLRHFLPNTLLGECVVYFGYVCGGIITICGFDFFMLRLFPKFRALFVGGR